MGLLAVGWLSAGSQVSRSAIILISSCNTLCFDDRRQCPAFCNCECGGGRIACMRCVARFTISYCSLVVYFWLSVRLSRSTARTSSLGARSSMIVHRPLVLLLFGICLYICFTIRDKPFVNNNRMWIEFLNWRISVECEFCCSYFVFFFLSFCRAVGRSLMDVCTRVNCGVNRRLENQKK